MSCHDIGLADGGWDDILHRCPHVRPWCSWPFEHPGRLPEPYHSPACRGQSGINPMQPRCFVRLEGGKKTIDPSMSRQVHAQRTMLGGAGKTVLAPPITLPGTHHATAGIRLRPNIRKANPAVSTRQIFHASMSHLDA